MDKQSKVLYFSRTTLFGGAEISMYDLIRKLDNERYQTVCILPNRGGLLYKKLQKEKVEIKIFQMPFIRKTFNPFLLFWFFIVLIYSNIRLIFTIKKINPDIVVCNSFQDSFYAAIPTKILRKKLIINIKNILDKKWKKKFRAKICEIFANKIIASSKKNANDYKNYSNKKEKAIVIYDGIDADEFGTGYSEQDVYLEYLSEEDKSIKIINVGNISELKGQLLLVESITSEILKDLDLKVFLVGSVNFEKDISYKEKIVDFVKKECLKDKVFFTGYIENIKDYIAYSDIVVHCPILEEGLGMVVLQAFCYKKLVIGTNIGGIPEMIDDNENGFLCQTNSKDLAEKIFYLIENINNLNEIRQNGYQKLRKYFTLDDKIVKTEKVYQELLSK